MTISQHNCFHCRMHSMRKLENENRPADVLISDAAHFILDIVAGAPNDAQKVQLAMFAQMVIDKGMGFIREKQWIPGASHMTQKQDKIIMPVKETPQ